MARARHLVARGSLLTLVILAGTALAQEPRVLVVAGKAPDGGGGGLLPAPTDEITAEQRARISAEIAASIASLREQGRLVEATTDAHVLFRWPVRLASGLTDPGHHGISNFVDHNAAWPNALRDFNCGARTYDSGSYNHAGTDIFTAPWWWRKMDRSEVEIAAAAPGQIVYRSDGNYDRNCSFNGGNWNAVYVRHADGSVAWYGHMKNGSPTSKGVGSVVAEGEYLGLIGSSGNSTGPHLHFEVHDQNGSLIDPFWGTCNGLNSDSWWWSQPPYYDSALNRITTGDAPVEFPACPSPENPRARVAFGTAPRVYFTMYYRDQLLGQNSTHTIYRPNGSIYSQWNHSSSAPHYAWSYWYWWFDISSAQPAGTWRFTVTYQGRTHERFFTIGTPAGCGRVPQYRVEGTQLTATRSGSELALAWGASCNPNDTDYVVYEGMLGAFSSHAPVLCSTAGLRSATVSLGSGNSYFLVAPRNSGSEGSLGRRSDGVERPGGVGTCAPRVALDCP